MIPNPLVRARVDSLRLIDTTLREGEQFAGACFAFEDKVEIARHLDAFGVDYIELTSPVSSSQSRRDLERIAALGLRAKVLTHVRCRADDARAAIESGAQGVDLVIGTSSLLRRFSHGKDIEQILAEAVEVIQLVASHGLEVRFSGEDSFRSELADLLWLYRAAEVAGAHRVGVADTVGVADPLTVFDVVRTVRGTVRCDIEFHGHNDTGCAVANAFAAFQAGATHVDTSVLGIGERNGITSLGAFVARLYVVDSEAVRGRYDLASLRELERYVARLAGVEVPFNNPVTGPCAFTHRAGIHAKAMLAEPSTYEVLDPGHFGLERSIDVAHRLTGWNAVRHRAGQLAIALDEQGARELTLRIKALADVRAISEDDVDALLRDATASGAVPEAVR
ncbi:MAG TPA: homocitrate synthase [Thermoanaerobaculia bacterium]|nr:homocitrate synthase [Thermoanaerobaculia bacterium]